VVGARISRSGDATPQPGDLEGQSDPVAHAGKVQIVIDRVRE
jgi:cytochrome c-type biogenesis protein CcmH